MHSEMDHGVSQGLGFYFLVFGLMNAYYTWRCFRVTDRKGVGAFWALFTIFLLGTRLSSIKAGLVLADRIPRYRRFVDGPDFILWHFMPRLCRRHLLPQATDSTVCRLVLVRSVGTLHRHQHDR